MNYTYDYIDLLLCIIEKNCSLDKHYDYLFDEAVDSSDERIILLLIKHKFKINKEYKDSRGKTITPIQRAFSYPKILSVLLKNTNRITDNERNILINMKYNKTWLVRKTINRRAFDDFQIYYKLPKNIMNLIGYYTIN